MESNCNILHYCCWIEGLEIPKINKSVQFVPCCELEMGDTLQNVTII